VWSFDGGIDVPASASPLVVRAPFSVARAVDPEEAFVASIASCHMLFFLDYAATAGFVVDRYIDDACGAMGTNAHDKPYVATVTLSPQVAFSGSPLPTDADVHALHERAHDDCYLANSVLTQIVITPAAWTHTVAPPTPFTPT
jgi:organic hydroperoxide reductase OsmC/OhrA